MVTPGKLLFVLALEKLKGATKEFLKGEYSEHRTCPWCGGGSTHADDCVLWKFASGTVEFQNLLVEEMGGWENMVEKLSEVTAGIEEIPEPVSTLPN